jgi:cytochrome c-type biogenesis protein CcmH/NrfG
MTFRPVLVLAAACALALSGCGRKAVTPTQRTEAANMVSEAEFAVSVKEWSRAEGLYTSATALCPDEADTWVKLGVTRMRLGNHSGARDAYKSAASAYKAAIKANPGNTQAVVRLAYVYVVLGRADDAKDLVEKAHKDHPDDPLLGQIVSQDGINKLLADPGLKEISP